MRAPIMIVGLNPSRHGHNESGVPFRTKAGQLTRSGRSLILELEKLGAPLENFYFTELTKCHAPNNVPTAEEIQSCTPYLREEIQLLRPRRVVALGGIVARELKGLGEKIRLVQMKHPSYVQRFLARRPGYYQRAFRRLLASVKATQQ
jgi:DNA polymerase